MMNGQRSLGADETSGEAQDGQAFLENARNHAVGVLTRTVFSSPDVHWILQADLRLNTVTNAPARDVAFIGSRGIEIKELLPALNFQHVASHLDFGARVLGAKVLDVHFAPTTDTALTGNGHVKSESTDQDFSSVTTSSKLPRQLLILTLESQELALVHLGISQTCQTTLTVHAIAMPAEPNLLGRLGYFIATDPTSRAFAVAAYTDRLIVYSTQPVDSNSGAADDVIKDQVLLKIESGLVVLQMDFLHTIPGHENMIHLILIVAKERRIKLMLYTWDYNKELTPDNIQLSYCHPLSREIGMPTLLVPLKLSNAPGSFMIVSESSITLYTNSHLRWPQSNTPLRLYQHDIGGQFDNRERASSPGSSPILGLWSAWTRPQRRTLDFDDIYLGREDGLVWYLHIEKKYDKVEITRRGEAGRLEGNIGTAFASLNLGINVGDTILFNGEMSNGGFYEIGRMYQTIKGTSEDHLYDKHSRADLMKLRKRETFHNWIPFLDVAAVGVATPYQPSPVADRSGYLVSSRSGGLHARHSVFATSGKNSSGSICQLRFGAEVPLRIRMYEEELKGASHIWALRGDAYEDFIILAFPHQTIAITSFSSQDAACSINVADEATLAATNFRLTKQASSATAASSANFATLLVTPSTVKHLTYAGPENVSLDKEFPCPGTSVAAIESETCLILRVHEDELKTFISVMIAPVLGIDDTLSVVGESLQVDVKPTCACFFPLIGLSSPVAQNEKVKGNMDSKLTLAGLGTSDGRVTILKIDGQKGPCMLFDLKLCQEKELSSEWACEDIAVLHDGMDKSNSFVRLLLLCGTRNGLLFCLDLALDATSHAIAVSRSSCISMGSTGVRIQKDVQRTRNAFVHCNTEICYFSYDRNKTSPITMQSIWFVDRSDASLSHEQVSAITQLPVEAEQSFRRMAGNLVCLSEGSLMFGPLEKTSYSLPRKWPIPGTPNRIFFSTYLQKLVVATNTIQIDEKKRRRASVAFMYLMKVPENKGPDNCADPDIDSASSTALTMIYQGQPGEKITGILEWEVLRDGKSYHLLVASKIYQLSDKTETGGLTYIQIRGNRVQRHDNSEESQPVRCISLYKDSLLLCSGDKVKMRTLSPEMRFQKRTLCRLNSPGLHMSVVEPFVYVTTAKHSLVAFKFEGDELIQCSSDTSAMEGLYHLTLPERELILFSDKHCSVVGVHHQRGLTQTKSFQRRFEARLPCSMTRLFQASLSPPWKERNSVGVLHENIYGTATDGSLFSFKIVNEAAWRLLRFIQNMCMRDASICRPQVQHAFHLSHVEPGEGSPRDYHVNGDILYRLITRDDAKEMLQSMLDKSNEHLNYGGSSVDFNSAHERRLRFAELVKDLRQSVIMSAHEPESVKDSRAFHDDMDGLEMALTFMQNILELPF